MEFNDEKHLENFLAKANREGKKIIGHEIISNPCVWIVERQSGMPKSIPVNYAREYGLKSSIEHFEELINKGDFDFEKFIVKFDNIKSDFK